MRQKISSFLIGIVMVGAAFCSCEEVSPNFTAPMLSAERQEEDSLPSGSTVHYVVHIEEATGPIQAFGLDLAFDPAHLSYTGTWERGNLTKSFTEVGTNEVEAGRIRVGGFTVGESIPETSSGDLVVLEFEVLSYSPSRLSVVAQVDDLKDMKVTAG